MPLQGNTIRLQRIDLRRFDLVELVLPTYIIESKVIYEHEDDMRRLLRQVIRGGSSEECRACCGQEQKWLRPPQPPQLVGHCQSVRQRLVCEKLELKRLSL